MRSGGVKYKERSVAGAMIAGALRRLLQGRETAPKAYVEGHAAEESPDSKGRDGG
jgi:hypothetical protein